MDFARGHPNTRSQSRRNVINKIKATLTDTVSQANPIVIFFTLKLILLLSIFLISLKKMFGHKNLI